MANKGLALYKRENDLYILNVAYEYADTKFVGFDESADVYKINKLNDQQKEWLKTHDPKKSDKTKNYIFVGDYYLFKVSFKDFPKGKPYTQLPGGGGVYKETRKYNVVNDLFTNETVLKAIQNYGTFNETYHTIRKIIREVIEKLITTKKIKKPELKIFKMLEDPDDKSSISVVDESGLKDTFRTQTGNFQGEAPAAGKGSVFPYES